MFQRLLLAVLLCLLLIVVDLCQRPAALPAARAADLHSADGHKPGRLTLNAQGHIPMPPGVPAAHACNLLAMPQGHPWSVVAFWFAGSKEAAPDVQIAAAYFDRARGQWSAAHLVLERLNLAQQLGFGVTRLGNPVAWLDGQGRVHLFVVATGLGGWAASRIVHLRQTAATHDLDALQFKLQSVLPLSWLWNYSHLVRAAPLPLQDGGMVLPAYFELGSMVSMALRFDAEGRFRGMTRMSGQTHLLQPQLLPLSDTHWLALMRNGSPTRKVGVTQTLDGGAHWQDLPELALDNPDASIAALKLSPNHMVLAHNATTQSRSILDLSESTDGVHWSLVQHLAHSTQAQEFSYPSMVWADNMLWVSYTDQRKSIAWQRFAVSHSQR